MATPFKVLSDLLVSHFTPAELQKILQDQGKDNLRFAVAWGNPPATVVADLVDGLRRYGEADLAFFQALLDLRPAIAAPIREAALVWIGSTDAARLSAPARPAPVAPVVQPAPPVEVSVEPLQRSHVLTIRCTSGASPRFSVEVGGVVLGRADLDGPELTTVNELQVNLSEGLRWLLERSFKAQPSAVERERSVLDALEVWASQTFARLFADQRALREYTRLQDAETLDVQVVSDDPSVLSWPWEALREAGGFAWGLTRKVRVSRLPNATPLRQARRVAPQQRVHVLMVTARPKAEDVDYLMVSGPLVQRMAGGPVDVTLLRPPTLDALQATLEARPGYYQVLHFDGHGRTTKGVGELLFEDDQNGPDWVSVDLLATSLVRLGVDLVVLNACRSASLGVGTSDPFAPVAAGLLRAGVGAVLAMSYVLHVDAARLLVPAFYAALAAGGDPLASAQVARLRLASNTSRRGSYGPVRLPDWMVPVVYENRPNRLVITPGAAPLVGLPEPLGGGGPEDGPVDLVGRDADLLWLERMMLRGAPALMVVGPAAVGSSALLWSFLVWRHLTGGLPHEPLWVRCSEVRDLSAALAVMSARLKLRALAGPDDGLTPAEVDQLIAELGRAPRLIVLDDVHALPVAGGLAPGVALLNRLLTGLKGTDSRVLISGRSENIGVKPELRAIRRLAPLQGAAGLQALATLTAEAATTCGYACFPGDPDVQAIAARALGLPGVVAALGPHLTDRDRLLRASALLAERAAALQDGRARHVIDEVVAALSA